MGDMGFLGVRQFIIPFRRPVGVAVLPAIQRMHNRRVNRLRWRVENVFAVTKKWRFFQCGKTNGRFFPHDAAFGMLCLAGMLHNTWLDWSGR